MAKKTIGELATLVTARVEPFKRGMQQAGDHTKRFQKQATGLTRFMDGQFAKSIAMGGAIGASVAAANKLGDALQSAFNGAKMAAEQTFQFVKTQLGEMDKIAKDAGAIGVDAESFQRVSHVLKKAGIDDSVQMLIKFRDTLGDLAREQSAIARGDRAAKSQKMMDLEALGLNLDDLRAASLDQALAQVAEAVKFAGDMDVSLLNDLLGRQGGRTREFFAQGGDEVARAFEADRDLGFVGDAELARVEAFNDKLADITTKLTNIGRQLVVDVADQLMPIAEAAANFVRKLTAQDVRMAFQVFIHELERMANIMMDVGKSMARINDNLGGVTATNAMKTNPVEGTFRQATRPLNAVMPGASAILNIPASTEQGQKALNYLDLIARSLAGGDRGKMVVGSFR